MTDTNFFVKRWNLLMDILDMRVQNFLNIVLCPLYVGRLNVCAYFELYCVGLHVLQCFVPTKTCRFALLWASNSLKFNTRTFSLVSWRRFGILLML